MTEKLSDLFERAQAPVVTWNDNLVHSMYELPGLAVGTILRIEFDDPNPSRSEGLRLRMRGGSLIIEERELDDIVLWSDSSPRVVTATVNGPKGGALRLWNCWRDPGETMQAWIGNAGMLVESTRTGIVLKCSDGFGEASFDDLVATIEISRPPLP
jgi:hypothetical protein